MKKFYFLAHLIFILSFGLTKSVIAQEEISDKDFADNYQYSLGMEVIFDKIEQSENFKKDYQKLILKYRNNLRGNQDKCFNEDSIAMFLTLDRYKSNDVLQAINRICKIEVLKFDIKNVFKSNSYFERDTHYYTHCESSCKEQRELYDQFRRD